MFAFWRTFRLGIYVVAFVGLGIYLGFTTPWHHLLGRKPNVGTTVREGNPIVAAIYRYRAETGLWPEYLDDLAPKYLAAAPRPAWYFVVTPGGRASLATTVDAEGTHVGYAFDAPGWREFDNDGTRVLRDDKGAGATHPAPPVEEVRIENEVRELDRRIAREPTLMEHRRAKAAVLVAKHRMEEARGVIELAAHDSPADVWPRLARAALDPTPEAVAAFALWTVDHPSFTHEYYVSLLYRRVRDDAQATRAIERALREPIELGADDTHILAYYLFDMARYALRQNQYPLVVSITNAWQRESEAHHVEENSYLPLRAAAELAQGNRAAAQRDLDMLETLKTRTWAQRREELKRAVENDERGFVYDPGDVPGEFEVFPLPE